MKKVLALVLGSLLAVPAFAQGDTPISSPSGNRHMFQFTADTALLFFSTLSRSNTRGKSADNGFNTTLVLNYAYALPQMPKLQVGARMVYNKQDAMPGRGDAEDYAGEIGGFWNTSENLKDSPYASLFVGIGWANTYGGRAVNIKRRDELWRGTLAVGKRFSLENWGMNHFSWTPEIALQNINSTTGDNVEYRQDIQFRFLQFSAFF